QGPAAKLPDTPSLPVGFQRPSDHLLSLPVDLAVLLLLLLTDILRIVVSGHQLHAEVRPEDVVLVQGQGTADERLTLSEEPGCVYNSLPVVLCRRRSEVESSPLPLILISIDREIRTAGLYEQNLMCLHRLSKVVRR